jgi:putative addiction module component (TIGR02574 family)
MKTSILELEAEVLSLSPPDRARIVERLLDSFEQDSGTQDAWVAEALRREEEVLSEKADLVPGAEAVSRIRTRIS